MLSLKRIRDKARLFFRKEEEPFKQIFKRIGIKPKKEDIYKIAFTHSSVVGVHHSQSNERLEYLGDSFISLVVGASLYKMYPKANEGKLTAIRAILVSRKNLNKIAIELGLPDCIYYTKGLRIEDSDLPGNCLEALTGAIYLDRGHRVAESFVRHFIIGGTKKVEKLEQQQANYKAEFIMQMQRQHRDYEFRDTGRFVDKRLGRMHRVQLLIEGYSKPIASGVGQTKKAAQQAAAKDAMRLFKAHKIQ